MERKIRLGVIGAYRGRSMINYYKFGNNVQLVAICDFREERLELQKLIHEGEDIAYYTDYDEFLKHDMDAVVLANYANEHAPFAIKALRAGKHVLSEVLPVQTMKEAVELIETIEETGLIYSYAENYCYMPAPAEMRKLYRQGKIGEFEYGEGEYIHNCEPIWPAITYGEEDHWRNNMYSTFYFTHSFGPIVHITGLRPVRVTGYEGSRRERNLRTGAKGGQFGVAMVEMENGALVKSIDMGLYKNSIWYTVYGSKGRMESAREDTRKEDVQTIYVNADEYDGQYGEEKIECYKPASAEQAAVFGHGGSDFYTVWNFAEAILGNPEAETIDIYEALDMFLPGMFAYRSILAGGIPMDVPNLRDPEEREKWRNDTACTDPKVAGDMLLPTCASGTPDIDASVYAKMKDRWDDIWAETVKKTMASRKNEDTY